MNSSHDHSVGAHLLCYLSDADSFDDFQDWLVGAKWDMEHARDHSAMDADLDLAYLIENRFAEYTSDYITEKQLKDALRGDLQNDFPALAAQLLARSTS